MHTSDKDDGAQEGDYNTFDSGTPEDQSSVQEKKCTDTLLFKVWLAVTIIVPSIFILLLVFGTCQFAKTEKKEGDFPGHLLRSMQDEVSDPIPLHAQSTWLDGVTNYRAAPGVFPKGMTYHFDGLAVLMSFEFKNGSFSYKAQHFNSLLSRDYHRCIFLGPGTGPTVGYKLCWQNPAVNVLPIADQLWATVDTAYWGRIDPETLQRVPGKVHAADLVLNAHPACDPRTGECYVQHPCSPIAAPITNQACISQLVPHNRTPNMHLKLLSRVSLPESLLIQHAHSLCVTPDWFVAHLESFGPRPTCPDFKVTGMLNMLHQAENNMWIVMNRKTFETRVMSSGNHTFVNNHFWNCYEHKGQVVTELVAATGEYLDAFFAERLKETPHWDQYFHPPKRCYIPPTGSDITCEQMMKDPDVIFDYPTYNPNFKMNPHYKWVYGVGITNRESRLFDSIVKINAHSGTVQRRWDGYPDLFVTEADFVPRTASTRGQNEDDGVLLSVVYNWTEDKSYYYIFDADTLKLVDSYPLQQVIPYHAHGVVCTNHRQRCFTNP